MKIIREKGTDHRFAGLLEKAGKDADCSSVIYVEPMEKARSVYFAQDTSLKGHHVPEGCPFVFYVEPGAKYGENSALVTYAADPELHRPHDVEKIYDVGFVGEPHGDERPEYLELIDKHFNAFISNETLPLEMSLALSKCKVLFNYIRFVDVNLRFFEAMAIGCQVVNRKPSLEVFAKEGTHYVAYDSPEECVAVIQGLLDDEKKREGIAKQARKHVLSHHTYKHRVVSIQNHLEELYGV